jgi:fructose-1,6-bisphosphatase I
MSINRKVQTLDEFTIQQLRDFPHATGELSNLLRNIGLAAKRVNVEVNKAGLVDILGDAGMVNVQGEKVKKLDIFANDQFIKVVPVLPAKSWMISWPLKTRKVFILNMSVCSIR